MIIGVSREVKNGEYRVGLTPSGVRTLVGSGHRVLVETKAGDASGFNDRDYHEAGASIISESAKVYSDCDMVAKVKEPQQTEYGLFRKDLVVCAGYHLASDQKLTHALMEKGTTAVAYDTIQLADGRLPILTPMSQIAGRLAVQVAAQYLGRAHGGNGKLLSGVPGVPPCTVVIIGGGVVGTNAAQVALGMGARVVMITRNLDRIRYLSEILHGKFETLVSNPENLADAVGKADVVIGAVLVTGARPPIVVTRDMVKSMRHGSVIVDVASDQGGCIETIRTTTHSDPTYVVDGVIHYGVPNMPGDVPRTSTIALTNTTLPYILGLADLGFTEAVSRDSALAMGVNVYKGRVTHPGVAEAHNLDYTPLSQLLC